MTFESVTGCGQLSRASRLGRLRGWHQAGAVGLHSARRPTVLLLAVQLQPQLSVHATADQAGAVGLHSARRAGSPRCSTAAATACGWCSPSSPSSACMLQPLLPRRGPRPPASSPPEHLVPVRGPGMNPLLLRRRGGHLRLRYSRCLGRRRLRYSRRLGRGGRRALDCR